MGETSDVPEDVEATWDAKGFTAVFPGAALTVSDVRTAFALFVGGTFVILAPMQGFALLTDRYLMTAQTLLATAIGVSLLFLFVLALDWLRGIRPPSIISVHALSRVSYRWHRTSVPAEFAVRDLRKVQLLSGERAGVRVELASEEVLEWNLRDVVHAAWLVEQLEQAMTAAQIREGQPTDVPEQLRAMIQRSTASE